MNVNLNGLLELIGMQMKLLNEVPFLHPMCDEALDRIDKSTKVVSVLCRFLAFVVGHYLHRLSLLDPPPLCVYPPPPVPPVEVVLPSRGHPHEIVWDPLSKRFRCVACWSSNARKIVLY